MNELRRTRTVLLLLMLVGMAVVYSVVVDTAHKRKVAQLTESISRYTTWQHVDQLVDPDPVLIRDESGNILGVYRRLNYPLAEGLDTTYWLDMTDHGNIVQIPAHSFVKVVDNPYGQIAEGGQR